MLLCQRHIETLRVPKDWTVSDERDGTPRLWTVTVGEVTAPTPQRGRVRRQRADSGRILEVEELQLFELDDVTEEKVAAVASLDDARNHVRLKNRSAVQLDEQSAMLRRQASMRR